MVLKKKNRLKRLRGIKNSFAELIPKESKSKKASYNLPEMVFNVDRAGIITFVSHARKGINLNKLVGRKIYELMPQEHRAKARGSIKKVFEKGVSASYESKGFGSSKDCWYVNHVKALKHEGKVIAATIKSIDITRFKIIEADLKKERDWSKALIQSAPNIVVGLGKKSKILLFNDFAEKLTGYKAEEVLGRKWIDLFIPKKDRRKLYRVWNDIVHNKLIKHNYTNSIITKKGGERTISWSNSVLAEKDRFKMVLSLGQDITEQIKAEEKLRANKNWFRRLYEYAPIAYHTLNSDGIITNVNNKWCEMLGYSKEEVVGREIFDFVIKNEREASKKSFESKKLSKADFISGHLRNYVTKKGEVKKMLINDFISYTPDKSINLIQTTMQDVTEHESAKQALRDNEESLKAIIESANDAIVMIGPDKKIILWNNTAVNMFGYTKEEVIGKSPKFLINEKFKHYFERQPTEFFKRTYVSALEYPYELNLVRRDGSSFPAEFTVSPVKIGGKLNALLIIRDMTAHNEMKRMKVELEHEKELEQVKNDFLMMITHELKQPISPILGFAELIKKQLKDEKTLSYLDAVISSAENMRGSVMKILNLMKLEAGKENFKFIKVDLSGVINQALINKLSAVKLRDIKVVKKFKNVFVKGNKTLLVEVFNNLVDNAVKFSKKGDKLIVRTWSKDGFAFASVKDYGKGINPEEQSLIFNKFYQTEAGLRIGGFGIGLSICDKIIKAHDGEIKVRSQPGKGSEFTVVLKEK